MSQPVNIGKPRLIKARLKPVCRGVFEEFVFEDSQEYINELIAKEKKRQEEERKRKEEAARKAAEEAKLKADIAAKKKADEEAARKKAADEAAAKKKIEEEAAAKKKADEEAAVRKKADEEAAAKKKAEESKKPDGIPDNVSNFAQKQAAMLDEPDGQLVIKPKPWTAPKWKKDPQFDHKTSIFAEFNVDDEDDLKKMFEYDMKNSRLSKFYSEASDVISLLYSF